MAGKQASTKGKSKSPAAKASAKKPKPGKKDAKNKKARPSVPEAVSPLAREGDNTLSYKEAQKAASAKLALDPASPYTRWFNDPLNAPNEYKTIRDCIEGQAAKYGAKTFLIYEEDGSEYSYRDLDRETSINVNLIRELGASEGARIGVLDANTPDFVFLYTGCMKGSYTSCPLNYHLKAPELQFCLENSESELLFVSTEFWPEIEKAYLGLDMGEGHKDFSFLTAIAIIGKRPAGFAGGVKVHTTMKSYQDALSKRMPGAAPVLVDFAALRKSMKGEIPDAHPKPKKNTQGEIIYTSGTTGKPKGVILRHHQFLSDGKYISRWYRMSPDTRMMMILPLFHVNAEVVTTMTPLVAGGSVVMFKKFSASRFWPAVEEYRVDIISVVPTILSILNAQELKVMKRNGRELAKPMRAKLPQPLAPFGEQTRASKLPAITDAHRSKGLACAHDISSLRRIICGAAPLPAEVQLAFESTFLVPIIEGYGLSETTCYSTFNPIEGNRKVATIGVEVGNQVAIFGANNRGVGRDEMGEIVIRGENVMLEYFKRPDANVDAFSGGWFHSGDVGEIDCDGFVRIRDRVKDMIIRGGENIYPREIDEVLYTHPEIENAATIGIPHAKYGEEVASFVVTKSAAPPTGAAAKALEQDIIAYCRERLANYKVPRSVTFIKEIPKGPTGKLLRRALRDMVAGK